MSLCVDYSGNVMIVYWLDWLQRFLSRAVRWESVVDVNVRRDTRDADETTRLRHRCGHSAQPDVLVETAGDLLGAHGSSCLCVSVCVGTFILLSHKAHLCFLNQPLDLLPPPALMRRHSTTNKRRL